MTRLGSSLPGLLAEFTVTDSRPGNNRVIGCGYRVTRQGGRKRAPGHRGQRYRSPSPSFRHKQSQGGLPSLFAQEHGSIQRVTPHIWMHDSVRSVTVAT